MRLVWGVLLVLLFTLHASGVEPVQHINKDSIQLKLEQLKSEFGFCKQVPQEIQSVFYTAIGYYPELKDVNIKVRYGNIKTTMQCRPRWDFIFHKKQNRSYVIYIDKKIKDDYGILFKQLPLNAQIGVMGHELAHIIDYSSLNNFQIASFGLDYLKDDKKKHIENRVDLIAIERGLGYQINDFSKYVFEDSGASFEYIKYKMKFYFRPSQIREFIAETPMYYTDNELLID
ncbi:MAG: hypothetical protein PF541_10455 [Prolixibacteraceae bacterium]|jgi:hypothetical protein|nr:hypothetical protein [Prolixibacteraceae bacterium]